MSGEQSRHVFVSYVREDAGEVDLLCKILDAAQIPYWRDRKSLGPGDVWKAKIRDAIRGDSLVFLACFSEQSRGRESSHMNEELSLAVEEFRKMAPGRTWLIPVRLDDGPVPEWELRPGQLLSDLNYVDLFGDAYAPQAAALVTTIGRLMGAPQPGPATTLAAVQEAREADRAQLVRRLTKEMLPDPSRRIELDDLVSQEIRRILDGMKDGQRFPSDLPSGSAEEKIATLIRAANHYWNLVEPFCCSLQVATRWASEDQLELWSNGIRSIASAATRPQAGDVTLADLRQIAALAPIMTVAVSAVASNRWDSLRRLVAEVSVPERHHSGQTVPLLEAVTPWEPFQHAEVAASALSLATTTGQDPESAAAEFLGRRGKYFTPVSDWLHSVLRPVFEEQLHDETDYERVFNTADVVLGVVGQAVATQRYGGDPNRAWRAKSRWFGRSTWQSRRSYNAPLAVMREELQGAGSDWPPLKAGLFDSDSAEALQAITDYEADFTAVAQRQH